MLSIFIKDLLKNEEKYKSISLKYLIKNEWEGQTFKSYKFWNRILNYWVKNFLKNKWEYDIDHPRFVAK
jgi:hypothetical protein